ncbi:MAG: HD-GYP domain-containing protein [Candidatus Methylumidiphilus sp.]
MKIPGTHKIAYVEKIKLRACDLRPGMYVCELDCPWLDTPFFLQGFEITSDADIEAVMQHCEHVYIDVHRTRLIMANFGAGRANAKSNKQKPAFDRKELQASASAHKQTTQLFKSFADEIRFGHAPKLHIAKAAVAECVAVVMANPTATLLMARLRDKDEYTSQHAFSVCIYSIILGRELGYDIAQLENLGMCGLLHDVGKLEIADAILNKPGKLTPEESAIMQGHTLLGRDILMSGRDVFSGAVDVACGHHENLDGSGYPRGLHENQISTNCKIVAVVDKYDALTTHRPYRPGQDHLSAVSVLNKLAKENKIDRQLKASFITYLGVYPPGSVVELNSGEIAIVIGAEPAHRLEPQLLVVRDPDRNPIQRFVDLRDYSKHSSGRPCRIIAVRSAEDFGLDVGEYYDLIAQAV